MAYLRELPTCDAGCGRQAAVELFTNVNGSLGRYCRSHGQAKLREALHREARDRAIRQGHEHARGLPTGPPRRSPA